LQSTLSIRHSLAADAGPPRTSVLELEPAPVVYPVQVVLYPEGPPQVIDTTGQQAPGGQVTITLPNVPPPPANTPIQVILYDGQTPTVLEGVTTPAVNGVYGIAIPTELLD
jgi:hypothetical protein